MAKAKKDPATKGDSTAAFLAHMAKTDKVMEFLHLSDDELLSNVREYLSTQSVALNKAIGYPGLPVGRLTEISGPEHTGKSTLVDHLLAETQRLGGKGVLIEPETSRDKKYATRIGVDADALIMPQPREGQMFTLEDTFNTVGAVVDWWKVNDPGMLVTIAVDSVASMPSQEDLERGAGERKPGEAAGILKHVLRNLCQRIASTRITLILVNQLYSRIGYKGWGDPKIEWGGSAIPYHASVRLRLGVGEKIKNRDGEPIGSVCKVTIQKSKVSGVSGRKTGFGIIHGVGIDNVYTIFERLKKEGYIANAGAWYSMILPDAPDAPLKWQGQHFGLADLCQQTPGLYDTLVGVFNSLP